MEQVRMYFIYFYIFKSIASYGMSFERTYIHDGFVQRCYYDLYIKGSNERIDRKRKGNNNIQIKIEFDIRTTFHA